MTEQNGCYLLQSEQRIIKQMSAYIASTANKGIVYLDTNIIPSINGTLLEAASRDEILSIVDFNSNLANRVIGHKADKVVITRDVKDEMGDYLSVSLSEIERMKWPKRHHERLAQTYETLQSIICGRQSPSEIRPVFQACYEIAAKLLEQFPKLKKDKKREKETDEKIVAHAFAQAIQNKKDVAIFSNDGDVVNIAREMYKILVAKNMGGDTQGCNLWTPQRIEAHPVEVWGYGLKNGSGKKLFIEKFAKKLVVSGLKWDAPQEAPSDYNVGKEKLLRRHIWQEIAAIDEAIGNAAEAGRFLDVITGTVNGTGNGVKEIDTKDTDVEQPETPAKPAEPRKTKTIITSGSKKLENKLEEVLYGLMPQENTEDLSQDTIETSLRRYRALKVLAKELKLPTDKINTAISRINGKSLPVMIKTLTNETASLVKKRNAITTDFQYFTNAPKKAEVDRLEQQINENVQKLQELTSTEPGSSVGEKPISEAAQSLQETIQEETGSSVEQQGPAQEDSPIVLDLKEPAEDASNLINQKMAALSDKELRLYEALKDAGYDAASKEEVWVPSDAYKTAAGLSGQSAVSIKLSKLEKAGKIERAQKGRHKAFKLNLDVLPVLVKGSKKASMK